MTHTMMTHRYYSRAAPTWPEATSRNLGEMGHTLLFPFRLHIFSHMTAAATSMSRDKIFQFHFRTFSQFETFLKWNIQIGLIRSKGVAHFLY